MLEQTVPQEAGKNNTKKLMKELLSKFGLSIPQKGAVLDGEVINVSLSSILIDLGPFGIGVVYPREFYDDPAKQKELEEGQKVKVVMLNLENEDGLRELSLKRAQMRSAWQEVKELRDKSEILNVKINNLNKGGLIAQIMGLQAFMPLSQLAEEHYPKVDNGNIQEIMKILQTYRNQEFKVRIIDVDEFQNKLIISERAARETKTKKESVQYKVGDEVEGKIAEITDFGAFVKLSDGTDALIPKAEMELAEEQEIREVFRAGQAVKATVIETAPDKIVLSLKK